MTVRNNIFTRLIMAVAVCFLICGCVSIFRSSKKDPFVFGVMADIQYGDKNTDGNRHYRSSLPNLKKAVSDLNKQKPVFVIQLGDIMDGYQKDAEKSAHELDVILAEYKKLKMPAYHVIGNHCTSAGLDVLHEKLEMKTFYYDFTLRSAKGWRLVVLDGNDAGYGKISKKQIAWFAKTLQKAKKKKEKVICFCHFPLLKGASPHLRLKNPNPVLHEMYKAGNVAVWFAGHDHCGGYTTRKGIHHLTLKAMVTSPKKNSYALIELHKDKIVEKGFGGEPSRELMIPAPK